MTTKNEYKPPRSCDRCICNPVCDLRKTSDWTDARLAGYCRHYADKSYIPGRVFKPEFFGGKNVND